MIHELQLLAYMLAAHALCDYPLQGDWLSKAKNPTLDLVPGETIWPLALTSHALIQAVAVQLVTGSWLLGCTEFVVHWLIDLAKCRKVFGYNADQLLHIGCKVAYFAALLAFGPLP
jgi:hypothetical protein